MHNPTTHQTMMEAPKFDDETGVPLNDAARDVVAKAKTVSDGAGGEAGSGSSVLDKIPAVEIAEGKWKYVQIELTCPGEPPKRVVRNTSGLAYHPDMYTAAMDKLESQGLTQVEGHVIGGGRIEYYPKDKTVSIYGYSKTFGRAKGCNKRSCEIVKAAFPDHEVTWSDDGY